MRLLQLILLFFVGLFIRRLWLAATRRPRVPRPEARNRSGGPTAAEGQDIENLTEQGITDADYEEIP